MIGVEHLTFHLDLHQAKYGLWPLQIINEELAIGHNFTGLWLLIPCNSLGNYKRQRSRASLA